MTAYSYHLAKHLPQFYWKTFSGILRRHDLQIPKQPIAFDVDYCFTRRQVEQWYELFAAPTDGSTCIPFTYAAPYIVLCYCDIFAILGINYRHVLHLRSELEFCKPGVWVSANENCHIHVELQDLVYTTGSRVAIVIAVSMKNAQGETLSRSRDFLFVNHVAAHSIAVLKSSTTFNRTEYTGIEKVSKRKPDLSIDDSQTSVFDIPSDMGRRYGVVSGDFNPIHTSRLLMRVFGFQQLFIQGMCACNWLIKTLTMDCDQPLSSLQITYCNPMYVGQSIRLLRNQGLFNLIDINNRLLAFGCFQHSNR